MTSEQIESRLQEISGITEPSLRMLRTAQLMNDLFTEQGSPIVVVGESAIELFTDGQYASGDVDICFESDRPSARVIAEVMGKLGASGGPRSFRANDLFIDILGSVETYAKTDFPEIGGVKIAKVEDLIAERVLMSFYPQQNDDARVCAEQLLAVALSGAVPVDWSEVERIASLPEYRVLNELNSIKNDMAASIDITKLPIAKEKIQPLDGRLTTSTKKLKGTPDKTNGGRVP